MANPALAVTRIGNLRGAWAATFPLLIPFLPPEAFGSTTTLQAAIIDAISSGAGADLEQINTWLANVNGGEPEPTVEEAIAALDAAINDAGSAAALLANELGGAEPAPNVQASIDASAAFVSSCLTSTWATSDALTGASDPNLKLVASCEQNATAAMQANNDMGALLPRISTVATSDNAIGRIAEADAVLTQILSTGTPSFQGVCSGWQNATITWPDTAPVISSVDAALLYAALGAP